jgi:hypothetical protein
MTISLEVWIWYVTRVVAVIYFWVNFQKSLSFQNLNNKKKYKTAGCKKIMFGSLA